VRRREFFGALAPLLAAPALIGLSRKSPRALAGGFVDDGGAAAHSLRSRSTRSGAGEARRVPIVIVGGGMAGLSAGWQLHRRGFGDFVILELEKSAGGNSRWGENDVTAYPWAAHYVPVPNREATLVRELFEELGVVRNGKWEERYLTFTPQERIFQHGQWREGIEPVDALGARGRADFRRFNELMQAERDTKRFTIPMEVGVRRDSPLDRQSMAAWMDAHDLRTPELRWYVDYACRDDYGALATHTSAWAGIHYFASREHEEQGPLTWPEGNGWIARRLIEKLGSRVVTGSLVTHIEPQGNRWRVATGSATYLAEAVIFAAPTFVLPYLMDVRRRPTLVYSPWLTANLVLDRPPRENSRGAPPSWDNVIYGSPSLGYVVATHQSLRSREDRTVWTYYWALADQEPAAGRQLLQGRSWNEWAQIILADLGKAHPDIRECVSRIDIMRLGHAMVRPTPGFFASTSEAARVGRPGLFLANSDLSGLSLFEEAQYRGVSAANSALARLGS
jgi:glycine/D-amino acid oxidase-like deaminating enzyme